MELVVSHLPETQGSPTVSEHVTDLAEEGVASDGATRVLPLELLSLSLDVLLADGEDPIGHQVAQGEGMGHEEESQLLKIHLEAIPEAPEALILEELLLRCLAGGGGLEPLEGLVLGE